MASDDIRHAAEQELIAVRLSIAEVNTEMRKLRSTRSELYKKRDRLARFFSEPPTGERSSGTSDKLGVAAVSLMPYINEWTATGQFDNTLAIRANISTKTLRNIKQGKVKFVTLRVADRILTALGYNINACDIPIIANPQWTREPNDNCG